MPRPHLPAVSRSTVVNSVIALALLLVVAMTVWTVRADDTADVSATQTATVDRGTVTDTRVPKPKRNLFTVARSHQ